MKHRILKRVIALCTAGCVMALTLAACGDSEENNEGTGTVQDVSQDVTREDEDGTVGVNENGDAVNVDSSGNDVRVAHASSSGNSGNGFAIPVFKPGEEPDPGQEFQPGEEPQQSQPDTGTRPSGGTQVGTGTQTTHTHSFQGGNCSTPAICSCGATGDYGSHNWVTQTVHHDAKGHYENRTTTEKVLVSWTPAVYKYKCICGEVLDDYNALRDHSLTFISYDPETGITTWKPKEGHSCDASSRFIAQDEVSVYENREKVEQVWVVDSAAWDEKVTTCSICGAKQ